MSEEDRFEVIVAYNDAIFATHGSRGPTDGEIAGIASALSLSVDDVRTVIENHEEIEYDKAAARSVGREY